MCHFLVIEVGFSNTVIGITKEQRFFYPCMEILNGVLAPEVILYMYTQMHAVDNGEITTRLLIWCMAYWLHH